MVGGNGGPLGHPVDHRGVGQGCAAAGELDRREHLGDEMSVYGRTPSQPMLDPALPDIGGETENGKRRCDEPYFVNGQIVARCQ